MSGPAASAPLTPSQRAVMNQIISYGRANGFNDYQIDIAVKTAYTESKLGKELGPNPKGTASGLFGYIDDNWDQGYGKKDNNSNQIRAFYDDLADFTWRYYDQPYGPIPTKDLSLAEYVYIKHHDGRYKPPSANSVGKRIWDHEPFEVPAGKNPPYPDETPPASSPFSAFSYLDLTRRPNALGPIDPAIWDHGAPPTGQNSVTPDAYLGPVERPNALGPLPPTWGPGALPAGENPLTGDPLLHGPGASSNLPFQHSPSGVTGAFPQGPPAPPSPVPADYPTWSLPSDSPLFPRRNLLEPAGSMSPWGQPQSGRDGSLVPSPRNVFGPWPGSYLEGPPDFPQSGSCNIFGPWPGSDLPERRNVLYPDPDLMELLGRYLSR